MDIGDNYNLVHCRNKEVELLVNMLGKVSKGSCIISKMCILSQSVAGQILCSSLTMPLLHLYLSVVTIPVENHLPFKRF